MTRQKLKLIFDVILLIIEAIIGVNAKTGWGVVLAVATGIILGICFLLDLDSMDLPPDNNDHDWIKFT